MKESNKIQKEIDATEEWIKEFKEVTNRQFEKENKPEAFYLGDKYSKSQANRRLNDEFAALGELKNAKDSAIKKEQMAKKKDIGSLDEEEKKIVDDMEAGIHRDSEGNPLDEEGNIDWFLDHENLPKKVQKILENFGDSTDVDLLRQKLEPFDYEFDYGLDSQPINLRKINSKNKENVSSNITEELKPGDFVKIPSLKAEGVISKIEGDIITVRIEDGFAVSNKDLVELISKEKKRKETTSNILLGMDDDQLRKRKAELLDLINDASPQESDSLLEELNKIDRALEPTKEEIVAGNEEHLSSVTFSRDELSLIYGSLSHSIQESNKILESHQLSPGIKGLIMSDIKEKESLLNKINSMIQ